MNRPTFFPLLLILLLALAARLAPAQSLDFGMAANPLDASTVSLRAAPNSKPLLPGKTAIITVAATIDPKYHLQSNRTTDDNIPAVLSAKTPSTSLTVGPIQYPVDHNVRAPGGLPGTIPVYEGTVYFRIPITLAADAPAGDLSLEIALRYQACDENSCLPPKTEKLTLPLTIGTAGDTPKDPDPALTKAADAQKFVDAASKTPATKPQTNTTTKPAAGTAYANLPLLSEKDQLAAIAERPYKPANPTVYPLWQIILFALVGGLILNVMPCVLPVIPLKALSLVQQAHGDRRLAVVHALVFTAGVVSLFFALAVVLRIVGGFYGSQFQSPAFLIAMVLFVVALALSMIGVWTINPPNALYSAEASIAGHSGYLGTFGNGLMATLLATPCSAPYLGPVIAWAFIQPAWLTALTLSLVGIGMSIPYLVLAAFPQLLAKFPRTGRWSELLKQGLGIVMIGVAFYLVTLISSTQLWVWTLYGMALVGLICWAWGQIPTAKTSTANTWKIRIASLLIGAGLGAILIFFAMKAPKTTQNRMDGEWQTFNVALLDAALKDGRPVIVDWTADWCINCHALETFVLSTDRVQQSFKGSNALLLKADLSEENLVATALNRKLGGEAIPVLAIFSPANPHTPTVLRDSYSPDTVINAVNSAK